MHGGGMAPFIIMQVFRSMGAFNQLRMDTTLKLILLLSTHSCHFTNCAYMVMSDYPISLHNVHVLPAFQPIFSSMLSEIYGGKLGTVLKAG